MQIVIKSKQRRREMGGTPNSYDITSEKLFYTKQSKAKQNMLFSLRKKFK